MKRLETGRIRALHLHGRVILLAAGLLVAAFAGRSASAQAVQLPTVAEVQDGKVLDLAGQSDATGDPYAARVWLAQGRVRWAIRAADRQRMHSEDRVFNSVDPELNEQILAIEVDEVRQRIWTLTESGLYWESYASPNSPSSPLLVDWMNMWDMYPDPPPPSGSPYGSHLETWEELKDLKVWSGSTPAKDRVFVLTTKRIIVIRVQPFEYFSSTWELFDEGAGGFFQATDPNDPINALEVSHLDRLRIQIDQNGKLMGYILSMIGGFGTDIKDRSAALVMLCDLDLPLCYQPTFDVDPGPDKDYVYFNPIPYTPDDDPTDDQLNDHTALSLDVFADGAGSRYMYVACGRLMQVQHVDVTNAFELGVGIGSSEQIGVVPDDEQHIRNVLVDPLVPVEPERRFFAVTKEAFYVCDQNDPPFSWTENEIYGEACQRDLIHVLLPGDPVSVSSVWTAVDARTDHICKVMDVSTNDHPVELVDEYYGISSCDGAVAIPPCDVYLPTFGGVVRYSGPADPPYTFQAVPDSYMPAEVPLGSGNVRATEHIDIGRVADVDRLFTASNKGDFMEFQIHALTGNPLEPLLFEPDQDALQTMGWVHYHPPYIETATFYGNDVVFLEVGQEYFVLTNLTNRGAGGAQTEHRQHAVLAYEWDDQSFQWDHVSTAMTPIIDESTANSKYVGKLTLSTSKEFAFCGFPLGFFVVDLRGLAATPPQDVLVPQVVFAGAIGDRTFSVGGLAQSKDRLFVYVNAPPGYNSLRQVRVYQWNETTGFIDERPKAAYFHDDLGFSSVFPNVLPAAFNGRFLPTDPASGAGFVHFAAGPELIQLEWPGGTSNTLSFTGYWRSDYSKSLQDCRSYEFGANPGDDTRILVVKNSEAFALVRPTQFP